MNSISEVEKSDTNTQYAAVYFQIWSLLCLNYIKMRSQSCNLKIFTY